MAASTCATPLPQNDPYSNQFWMHAKRGRLVVQRCDACGNLHFPPGPVCPACLTDEQSFQQVSGRGTLVSWVHFHHAYWEELRGQLPYTVCLVKLTEGPILISNLVDEQPEKLHAGAAVSVIFDVITERLTLPRFRLD